MRHKKPSGLMGCNAILQSTMGILNDSNSFTVWESTTVIENPLVSSMLFPVLLPFNAI